MNDEQFIVQMKKSGSLLKQVLYKVVAKAGPGITGLELDTYAEQLILKAGATPSFKHYHDFPASLCVSTNDEVVHGIPSGKRLQVGDVVGLDLGLVLDGAYTDTACTVIITKSGAQTAQDIQKIPENNRTKAQKLVDVTYQSMLRGLKEAHAGKHPGDIGQAVQDYAESRGYGVVRQLVGHGVGHAVHEEPSIPNFGKRGEGSKLVINQTIAVEPMITTGGWQIVTDQDGWTVRTKDASLAAHFEHTVIVRDQACEIIT